MGVSGSPCMMFCMCACVCVCVCVCVCLLSSNVDWSFVILLNHSVSFCSFTICRSLSLSLSLSLLLSIYPSISPSLALSSFSISLPLFLYLSPLSGAWVQQSASSGAEADLIGAVFPRHPHCFTKRQCFIHINQALPPPTHSLSLTETLGFGLSPRARILTHTHAHRRTQDAHTSVNTRRGTRPWG